MKKSLKRLLPIMIAIGLGAQPALAANQITSNDKTGSVNVNDYSTNSWDRYTYNFEFESGPNTKETFGVPTQTDVVAKNPELENVRRNKDAAFLPPSYGVFSGEIPTDPSSPYHNNTRPDQGANVTNNSTTIDTYNGSLISSMGNMSDSGTLPSTSSTMQQKQSNTSSLDSVTMRYSQNSNSLRTQVSLYPDGSMGTLKIPKLNMNVKVFEGETLDSMKSGVGHFEFTSAFDGNVAVAGHNRGSSDYLNGIWNLKNGDEIIYTTQYGQRTYKVFSVEKISDTDYSKLGWSDENMITLITCVQNQGSLRWAVQAIEK